MSRYGFCLAAGILLAAPVFVSGAETSGDGANEPVAGSTAALIDGGRMLLPVTTGFISPADGKGAGGGGGGQGLSAAPAISTAPEAAIETVPPFPQNQCFCIQPQTPTPFNPVPYYLGQLTTVSPKCASMKMRMDLNKKPVFEQVVLCEELGKCWKKTAEHTEKWRGLEKELAAARKKRGACCSRSGSGASARCDKKCRDGMEEKIGKLTKAVETNEAAAIAVRGACVDDFMKERMRGKPGPEMKTGGER